MPAPPTVRTKEVHDPNPDFVYAISLLAALEGASGEEGHDVVLPFLGMARAELTDFGRRRITRYVPVQIDGLRPGLIDLDQRLAALLANSQLLQHSLRIDAAMRLLRRGAATMS